MWNSVRALNLAANGLYVLAALAAAGYALHALVVSPAFPLRSIRVDGELGHVTRAQVVQALQGRVRGTFFTVDLAVLRRCFEAIPWVRRAEVRRVWPDRIEVRLVENVALARWGQPGAGTLLNGAGEVFAADTEADLPRLAGPAGSEREVLARYAEFSRLLAPLSLAPVAVSLSQRHAWRLRLSNGIALELGRDQGAQRAEERLERFVQAYPATIARMARAPGAPELRVDLRYPNGFALRLPQPQRAREAGAARPRV
ncbi:MAG: cell division protein FtsQ/DivIB [Burkholderiales bacterium]|nr:cell division protein FtsQ/DivIB [Burkholderiales bacterium]